MKKLFLLHTLLLLISVSSYAQEVQYDTTYKVTYENGIKDSIIVIYKRVILTEKVYIVDSTSQKRWAYDIFATPFFTSLSRPSLNYSSPELSNQNNVSAHSGQSIGGNIYYLRPKLIFRLGFNFSRHNYVMNSTRQVRSEVTNKYLVNDTLDVYYGINNNNDTTSYYIIEPKEVSRKETITDLQKRTAKFTTYYFDLALQAGYRRDFKKWSVYVCSGPVISFLLTSKGRSMNEIGEYRNIQEERLSSPIFNLQTNIQLSYLYNNSTHLFVEPYLQKYLFTINNVSTKLFSNDIMGLKMGVKIFL